MDLEAIQKAAAQAAADKIKELNGKTEELQNSIDAKLATMAEKTEKGQEYAKEIKGEVSSLIEQFNASQKQVDELATQMKRNSGLMAEAKPRTFKGEFMQGITKHMEEYKRFQGRKDQGMSFEIDNTKAVTEAGNLTGEVIEADYQPGIIYDPERIERVRNYMSQGVTTSNKIVYNQETDWTDNTEMAPENTIPTESAFTLTRKGADVKKIMSLLVISNEMMEDLPQVTSYVSTRAVEKLLNLEDEQLLNGDGTGENIEGISQVAGAFNPGLTVSSAQRWDVLRFGIAQLRTQTSAEYRANGILMHPKDVALMDVTKDSTGNYIFPGLVQVNGQRYLYGVPIFETTAVPQDKFYIGDWRLGCQLFQRRGISVEFSREAEFKADNTVVRISERIALPIYRPNAFIYGDFGDAIALISAT